MSLYRPPGASLPCPHLSTKAKLSLPQRGHRVSRDIRRWGGQCFTISSSPLSLKPGAMPGQASTYLPTPTCHSCPGLQATLNAANLPESVWGILDLAQHPFTYLRSIRLGPLFPFSPPFLSCPASLLSAIGNLPNQPFYPACTVGACKHIHQLTGTCRLLCSNTHTHTPRKKPNAYILLSTSAHP